MNGNEIIKRIVREDMPDIEEVRENCHSRFAVENKRSGVRRLVPVMAVTAMLLVISTTVFALGGGFEWFMQRFDPPFAETVEPVMAYSEDQGIRMTVIGARRFDNMAVVYLSLQDMTGQNRLTESFNFKDGFSVRTAQPETDTSASDVPIVVGGFSTRMNMLYFDEATNTAYLEIHIMASSDMEVTEPLNLSTFLVVYEVTNYDNAPIGVSLASLSEADTVPIASRDYIAGMSYNPADYSEEIYPREMLLPGRLGELPHAEENQWLSNIGLVDGRLRVQAVIMHGEFGAHSGVFSLISPTGEIIYPTRSMVLYADQDFNPVDLRRHFEETGSYQVPPYMIEEAIFDVDIDYADYTLAFTGNVTRGTEGNWSVDVHTTSPEGQVVVATNDTWVNGMLYEFMTLTPLGLNVVGRWTHDRDDFAPEFVYVETADGLITLKGGGGGYEHSSHTFNLNWPTESPLDVQSVTAIVIDGLRIPIE